MQKKRFAHIAASILAERLPGLMERLCSEEKPSFILLLGCGAGRGLLGLSESFPNARIQGVAEDDFSLSIAERLLKDRQNVQILKSEEFAARLPNSDRTYDLVVVESSFAGSNLLQALPEKNPLLRTGAGLLFLKPSIEREDEESVSFLTESMGLSNIEEGWVSRGEAAPIRFLLGRK